MDLDEIFDFTSNGRVRLPDWKSAVYIGVAVVGLGIALSIDASPESVRRLLFVTLLGIAPGVTLVAFGRNAKGSANRVMMGLGRAWQLGSLAALGLLLAWMISTANDVPPYDGLAASICEHVANEDGETLWGLMSVEAQNRWSPYTLMVASQRMKSAWRGEAPSLSVANSADPLHPYLVCSNARWAAGHAEVSFQLRRTNDQWEIEQIEFLAPTPPEETEEAAQ